jgi:phage terminase large subunit-like protein
MSPSPQKATWSSILFTNGTLFDSVVHVFSFTVSPTADQRLITLTDGATIEESWVEARIVELSQRLQIKNLLTDMFNATRVATACREKHGIPAQFLGQGWLGLNEPTKVLQSLIVSGKLRHRGHPILRWMASNCVVKMDAAANIKLDKSKRRYKIDGIAALVNALAGAIGEPPEDESVHEHLCLFFFSVDPPMSPYFRM